MIAAVFGPDLLIVLLIAIVGIVIPLWAIIDAASRPSSAFQAAGSSKGMWVSLIVVLWAFTGILGVLLAIVYLAAIRPRVRAVLN